MRSSEQSTDYKLNFSDNNNNSSQIQKNTTNLTNPANVGNVDGKPFKSELETLYNLSKAEIVDILLSGQAHTLIKKSKVYINYQSFVVIGEIVLDFDYKRTHKRPSDSQYDEITYYAKHAKFDCSFYKDLDRSKEIIETFENSKFLYEFYPSLDEKQAIYDQYEATYRNVSIKLDDGGWERFDLQSDD